VLLHRPFQESNYPSSTGRVHWSPRRNTKTSLRCV
jgi:hypothetical protein